MDYIPKQEFTDPSITHNDAANETSSTPSRGRKKRAFSGSPKAVKKRKTHLSVVLSKIIVLIRQKDNYGFFLNPVDPDVVPDYRNIIKNPMDLGALPLESWINRP